MDFNDLVVKKEIVLRDMGLCDSDLDLICEVISESQVVEELILSSNRLTLGSEKFADALAHNKTLRVLHLDQNRISAEGIKRLAAVLKVNESLQKIVLDGNLLSCREAKILARALMVNKTLQIVSLGANKIGDRGAQSLATSLRENKSLTAVGLRGNKIGCEGAKQLADALEKNCGIKSLFLDDEKSHVEIDIQTALDDPKRRILQLEAILAKKDEIIEAKDLEIAKKKAEVSSLMADLESTKAKLEKMLGEASDDDKFSTLESLKISQSSFEVKKSSQSDQNGPETENVNVLQEEMDSYFHLK